MFRFIAVSILLSNYAIGKVDLTKELRRLNSGVDQTACAKKEMELAAGLEVPSVFLALITRAQALQNFIAAGLIGNKEDLKSINELTKDMDRSMKKHQEEMKVQKEHSITLKKELMLSKSFMPKLKHFYDNLKNKS